MVKYENQCVGCETCIGSSCKYLRVPVHYCDKCKWELDEVFDVDGQELCEDCLKDMFRRKD
jgi:hypothetical protein